MANILVTGGAGYIGSHTLVELIAAGHTPVVVDSLCNSSEEAVRRVEKICGKPIEFHKLDITNIQKFSKVFDNHTFDAVIHFAGLKAVGESVKKPQLYYENNVVGSLTLLRIMAKYDVQKLVFSSSATVYGSSPFPYTEDMVTGVGITNPYGQTKHMVEQVMRDAAYANPKLQFVSLRYFNPVGAHSSGLIGEDPNGTPNNLMPYVAQTAIGKRSELKIWGDDYDTVDGTGVRDYIHVTDLARGHVLALEHLKVGYTALNLGSGKGTSVLEILRAFEAVCGKKIPYRICARRSGDLPEYYADASKAKCTLRWETKKTIDEICKDTWRWQTKNPNGYA